MTSHKIISVKDAELPVIHEMFVEYAGLLGIDLGFQRFDEELEGLPGAYSPPDGGVFMATVEGVPAGCIAFRILGPDVAEIKRLYVRERFRRRGIGRTLVYSVIEAVRKAGYGAILLDTLSSMPEARALYESAGFTVTEPYYHNPYEGTVFLRLSLR